MANIRVVTAFVPIDGHPRTPEMYSDLGKKLRGINAPLKAFYNSVQDCWLHKAVTEKTGPVTHSVGDNPAKNTLAYHIVQHQKLDWLGAASLLDRHADVFVWIDYGILHVPGVTVEKINKFLEKIKANDLAIPGCWGTDRPIVDDSPCWRFCGGIIVVPRNLIRRFSTEFQDRTMRNVMLKGNVTWETNDLARVEKYGSLPIRWYAADHDASMVDNYDA